MRQQAVEEAAYAREAEERARETEERVEALEASLAAQAAAVAELSAALAAERAERIRLQKHQAEVQKAVKAYRLETWSALDLAKEVHLVRNISANTVLIQC